MASTKTILQLSQRYCKLCGLEVQKNPLQISFSTRILLQRQYYDFKAKGNFLETKPSTITRHKWQNFLFQSQSTRNIFSSIHNKNSKEKWESLFENEEKRQSPQEIPVKNENIYTIPNLLSLLRLGLTPYIGYLVLNNDHKWALGLLVFASLTDVLDGHIARKWPSQQSALGSALDPLADKIMVAVLCLSLTKIGIIPWQLTGLFISRDVLLIAAVFYLRYRTCPKPRTLKRFFDPTLVNAKLSPTFISKINTALQVLLIWSSLAAAAFEFQDHYLLKLMWAVTATTTIWSSVSYITDKNTVQIVKDKKL